MELLEKRVTRIEFVIEQILETNKRIESRLDRIDSRLDKTEERYFTLDKQVHGLEITLKVGFTILTLLISLGGLAIKFL